ncbi:zinc finger, CCHC-type containing protein [Tanacetum coccineum]
MKVDGTIDKFKARLVIQGFRQKEGIDYFDTYAPVACITNIRLLLALTTIHNLVIHQMDVKTTFLNGNLDGEVYMKQPKGFFMPSNEHKVCKLVKSLYGLNQAPKQWHQKFDEVVLSSGFLLNQSDKRIYSKFDSSGKGVIRAVNEPDEREQVIDDEIGSIMENNTWVLSDLPPGCKPLSCKWIFKRKMKVDGTIDKFKARLVIQGFRQKEGIDYFDTYAPVACITNIRLLLALAAIHNLVIHQMDVKTTFLNGNEHKVCKLVKSLYGLNQAPKQWHQKFDEVVLSSGFPLNQSDKRVYSKFDSSGKGVIICLYVDDMLIFKTDQNQVDKTKKFLSSRFSMKDMGEANVILGIKIKYENKGIVITHSHYIEKILKKFNREDCSPVSTPMDPVEKLKLNIGKPVDQLEYSRAIGCLMYAMTSTRPDIAYVVGKLSRFTSNPSRQHWKAITRVFKYLRCTMNYGLLYVGYPSVLEAYSDANWINHVEDSSSTSGWVFLLGGGAISWASKK